MDDEAPTPPPRRGPSPAWSVALVLIAVSIAVSFLTPYKLFILFLPLGLAPLLWRRKH